MIQQHVSPPPLLCNNNGQTPINFPIFLFLCPLESKNFIPHERVLLNLAFTADREILWSLPFYLISIIASENGRLRRRMGFKI
jgi:hypothetical protein